MRAFSCIVSPVSAPSYLVFKGFVDYLTTSIVDPDSLNPDPDLAYQVNPIPVPGFG
jgi:hypothetical protein